MVKTLCLYHNFNKKYLTTRAITYNELIYIKNQCPRLKACAKTDSSKNAQNRQKTAKIGTLSVVPRVTRAPKIKILMFITRTRLDLATKKDFTKKYHKFAEIYSKIMDFLYTTPPYNGYVTDPQGR